MRTLRILSEKTADRLRIVNLLQLVGYDVKQDSRVGIIVDGVDDIDAVVDAITKLSTTKVDVQFKSAWGWFLVGVDAEKARTDLQNFGAMFEIDQELDTRHLRGVILETLDNARNGAGDLLSKGEKARKLSKIYSILEKYFGEIYVRNYIKLV